MRTSAKRVELLPPEPRPAYRTLEGWALGTLIEHGAVRECEHHGHMRDRAVSLSQTLSRLAVDRESDDDRVQ